MTNGKFCFLAMTLGAALLAPAVQADSLIDGTYKTVTDGSEGSAACTLVIKSIDAPHKYGDGLYELESAGTGACNWSAVGLSKSYVLTGGLITNGGATAFFKLSFPFGPAGNRIEITALDPDGSVRNKELFARQ